MTKERNTAKYHLKCGGKIVHRGITGRPLEEREREHRAKFPGSHITQVRRRTTREKALKWERKGGKR